MLSIFFAIAMTVTIVVRADNRGVAALIREDQQDVEIRQGIELLGLYVQVSYEQIVNAIATALVFSLLTWRLLFSGVSGD